MNLDFFFSALLLSCLILSCHKDNNDILEVKGMDGQAILDSLSMNYSQLPERQISISLDSSVYAQYTQPTDRYPHGILGDIIEAGQLVVVVDNEFYEYTLDSNYVFEDIRPRLYDVDNDGNLEFITIRTEVNNGAGMAIYKLVNNRLVEYAFVKEIGLQNRWLNIATIFDLDEDGTVELVWVQTPHIGGILKVAKIQEGEITILDQAGGLYSNHAIGERNLCLSALTRVEQRNIFHLPNRNKNAIYSFELVNNTLAIDTFIFVSLDFSEPLINQYTVEGLLLNEEDNCIF